MALIHVEGLSRSYRTGSRTVTALDEVSLEIEQGEFVAVVGPSGSGKSTFLNVLGCLDRPTGGTYRLDGVDVGRLHHDALAAIRNRSIGFVFQSFNLLPRTSAIENVELPLVYRGLARRERRRRAGAMLEKLDLTDRASHLPGELSGGQQQRVAIARAIVTEPRALLADEPTGALDSRTGRDILALFRRLNSEGITIILVTHEAEVAASADRVITFRDGRMVADEPAVEQDSAPRARDRLMLVPVNAG
jgi:putative ABC transport system ATP-binding protein